MNNPMSLEEAAEYLNVTAAFLLKTISQPECTLSFSSPEPGCILLDRTEVETYKVDRDKKRRDALTELTQLMEEEGVFD